MIIALFFSFWIASIFKIEFSAQVWVFLFFLVAYSLLLFFIIFAAHFFRTRINARKAAFLGERKYTFLDDHIVVETEEVNSTVKWSAIRSVHVGKNALYLYMDINAALLIPLRSIGDKQAQNDLLQFIRAHVPQKKK